MLQTPLNFATLCIFAVISSMSLDNVSSSTRLFRVSCVVLLSDNSVFVCRPSTGTNPGLNHARSSVSTPMYTYTYTYTHIRLRADPDHGHRVGNGRDDGPVDQGGRLGTRRLRTGVCGWVWVCVCVCVWGDGRVCAMGY